MIGIDIRFYKQVACCLACAVRAVRRIRGCLIKIAAVFVQGAIDLVGRHIQEFFVFLIPAVCQLPCLFRTVHQHCRPHDICLDKDFRAADAAVYMGFCRKMHHAVNIIVFKNVRDCFFVTDIGFHKGVIVPAFHILQVLQVASIGQCVQINYADAIPIFAEHIVNII